MTVEQLVARFIEIGEAQDDALLDSEIARFNRLYDEKVLVLDKLRGRDGDQRKVLIKLYDHPNMQVRLNAAKATLAVAPAAARRTLEQIAKRKELPQGGDAGMSLRNLDRGIFKPT
jgi:hypothetical protein